MAIKENKRHKSHNNMQIYYILIANNAFTAKKKRKKYEHGIDDYMLSARFGCVYEVARDFYSTI